jgi:hypothetical protein
VNEGPDHQSLAVADDPAFEPALRTRPTPRGDVRDPEHADYLAAIWIMASNDEVHIITYRGIAFRLGLDERYVRSLVASRPELFRLRAPRGSLRAWKETWTSARGPSWLKAIPAGPERLAATDKLREDDCFRSQFRADDGAERSNLEVIEWGLKHIERTRAAKVGTDESVAKTWQMMLAIAISILGIVAQLVIAATKQ